MSERHDHYAAARQCLDAAQENGDLPTLLTALVHAVLATAPPSLAYDAYHPSTDNPTTPEG